MKILVTVLLTALFVFALATTWVDFVQPQLAAVPKTGVEQTAPLAETAPIRRKPRKAPAMPADLLPVPADVALPPDRNTAASEPVADTKRLEDETAALLVEKMDEVKAQEQRLAARQETLRLIYDDIRTELATVDELRKRTSEDMAKAEQRMLNVVERKTPRLTSTPVPPVALRNASESPAVRGQALFIRRLVDDGKTETAISVLKSMKERDAASVLTALSSVDSPLADRLANRLADSMQAGGNPTVRR
jgi:flagellar motility protein MotE (MotC chaperone)